MRSEPGNEIGSRRGDVVAGLPAGGVRVPLTLRAPDFRPDLAELESLITSKTRLLLLNSPHNPTGMVLTRAETEAIARIAVDHDLLVITDEAYEHLTFDREHIPLATIEGMRGRVVSITSDVVVSAPAKGAAYLQLVVPSDPPMTWRWPIPAVTQPSAPQKP